MTTISINAGACTKETMNGIAALKKMRTRIQHERFAPAVKLAKETKAATAAKQAEKRAKHEAEIDALREHREAHMKELNSAKERIEELKFKKRILLCDPSIKESLGLPKMKTFRVSAVKLPNWKIDFDLLDEIKNGLGKDAVKQRLNIVDGKPIEAIAIGEKPLQGPSPMSKYLGLGDGCYTSVVQTVDSSVDDSLPFGKLSKEYNEYKDEIVLIGKVIYDHCRKTGITFRKVNNSVEQIKFFTAGGTGIKEGTFYSVLNERYDELHTKFNAGNEDFHLDSPNYLRKLALAFRPGVGLGINITKENTFFKKGAKIVVDTDKIPVVNINKLGEITGFGSELTRAFCDGMSVIIWDNMPEKLRNIVTEGSMLQLWSNDYVILKTEALVLGLERLRNLKSLFDIDKVVTLENGDTKKMSELLLITTTDAIKDKTISHLPNYGSEIWLFNEESESVFSRKPGKTSRQILESLQFANPKIAVMASKKRVEEFNSYEGVINYMMAQPGNEGKLACVANYATSEHSIAKVNKGYVKFVDEAVSGTYLAKAFTTHICEDYTAFLQYMTGVAEANADGILTGKTVDGKPLGVLSKYELFCENVSRMTIAVDRYPHLAAETWVCRNVAWKHKTIVGVAMHNIAGAIINVHDAMTVVLKADCDGDEIRIALDDWYIEAAKRVMNELMAIVNNEPLDGEKMGVTDTLVYGVLTNFIGTGSNMVRNAWEAYAEAETNEDRQSIMTDIYRLVAWCNWYVDAWKHGFPVPMDEELVKKYKGKHPYSQVGKCTFLNETITMTNGNRRTVQVMHDFADIVWLDGNNIGKLRHGSTPNDFAMEFLGVRDDFNGYLVHLDQWRGLGKITTKQVGTTYCEVENEVKIPLRINVEATPFDGRSFCLNKRTNLNQYVSAIETFSTKKPVSEAMREELDNYGLMLEEKYTPERIIRQLWIADAKANKTLIDNDDNHMTATLMRETRRDAETRILKYFAEQFGEKKKHVFLAMSELAAVVCFGKVEALGINDNNREAFTDWCIDVFGEMWYNCSEKNGSIIINGDEDVIADWREAKEIEEMF